MLLALLAKVIAIHVQLPKIYIKNLSFQALLTGDLCFWFLTFGF